MVVPQGKEREKQLINISLFALDPDEEEVTYSYKSKLLSTVTKPSHFFLDGVSLTAGWYNITGMAKDKYGKQDNQTVRVLVDRPIKVKVNVTLPFEKLNNEVSKNSFFISLFDSVW